MNFREMQSAQMLSAYMDVKQTHLLYLHAGWLEKAQELERKYALSKSQTIQKMPQNPYQTAD